MKKIILILIPVIIIGFIWERSSYRQEETVEPMPLSAAEQYVEQLKAKQKIINKRSEVMDCAGAPERAIKAEDLSAELKTILSIACYDHGHRLQSVEGEAWVTRFDAYGFAVVPVFQALNAQVIDNLADRDNTVGHAVHFTSVSYKWLNEQAIVDALADVPRSVGLPNPDELPVERVLELVSVNQDEIEQKMIIASLGEPAIGLDHRAYRAFGYVCSPDCKPDEIFKVMNFSEITSPSGLAKTAGK